MENNFYTPNEIKTLYNKIIPTYQESFAGPPWNEVSKCADVRLRCVGGLSSVALGAMCGTCSQVPTLPAYEDEELAVRFDALGETRPTLWYAEQSNQELAMAAVGWKAPARQISAEKYADTPEMADWLQAQLGEQPVVWLDEVFANRTVRPSGNLRNFGRFVVGMANVLGAQTVAYRTVEPKMTAVATRDFGDNAAVFRAQADVPDWRDVVTVKVEGVAL